MTSARVRARVFDYLIYVLVGVAFVFGIFWCAEHDIGEKYRVMGWVGLVLSTFAVGCLVVQPKQHYQGHRHYYFVLTSLLTLRVIVVGLLLWNLQTGMALKYMVLIPLEVVCIKFAMKVYFKTRTVTPNGGNATPPSRKSIVDEPRQE